MSQSIRAYQVVALNVPSRLEEQNFKGQMVYVLKHQIPVLKQGWERSHDHFLSRANSVSQIERDLVTAPVHPFVLRACQGERVQIYFENQLQQPTALHLYRYAAGTHEAGDAVNLHHSQEWVQPGGCATYEWDADQEGVFLLYDKPSFEA
ncbi:MAG TPA: multicopper oxidase domain-containing protein, partial [Allocoleopsis sp.]